MKCKADHLSGSSDRAGEVLLKYVDERKADLLVMGCYGHSRFREFILGGASRLILANMVVPVLMSHSARALSNQLVTPLPHQCTRKTGISAALITACVQPPNRASRACAWL